MRIRVPHSGQVRLTSPVPKIVSIFDMRLFERMLEEGAPDKYENHFLSSTGHGGGKRRRSAL
jgi:hypothetical protein